VSGFVVAAGDRLAFGPFPSRDHAGSFIRLCDLPHPVLVLPLQATLHRQSPADYDGLTIDGQFTRLHEQSQFAPEAKADSMSALAEAYQKED
jgi:hypothetical protein